MQVTNPHPTMTEPTKALSVIIAAQDAPDVSATLSTYRAVLDGLGVSYEVLCVLDARDPKLHESLNTLAADWPELAVQGQRLWTDEDAALQTTIERCQGETVLTLAGWPEITPEGVPPLLDALKSSDMAVATRQGLPVTWRGRILRRLLNTLFGHAIKDLFCRTRAVKRPVLQQASAFGVRQHFLPSITAELGYSVAEVEVEPVAKDAAGSAKFVFRPIGHIRALFDALSLYVVLKFLRRPLRFFGAIGMPIFVVGSMITLAYLAMRIFGNIALADRPGLIFAVLMVALGLQIIALGLVGEIIIFANSRRMKQYTVKALIRKSDAPPVDDAKAG